MRRSVCIVGVMAMVLAACGGTTTSDRGSGPVVVATTTQIADFVRNVAGDQARVHQILQPNSDPHEYEPRPGDVEAVSKAQVVFENGDGLDAWMGKLLSAAGGSPATIDLGAAVPERLPGETSGPEASPTDPHWWHDPRNAEAAVLAIRDALSRANPAAAATYAANAAAYVAKLKALDAGIATCFAAVPPGERRLVSDHDAFGYFARRYGITTIGAVIPSQSTEAQASAGEIASLVNEIRRDAVKAVFPETSISPRLAQQIAAETGARADYKLYGDSLGPKGSPGATYLSMEQTNADRMVEGFTGGARRCP
jgi:ABC-type Zn uptake system ZnuABC Zn-binding protein ZnuA